MPPSEQHEHVLPAGLWAAGFLGLGLLLPRVSAALPLLGLALFLGIFGAIGHLLHPAFLAGLFGGLELGLGKLLHEPGLADRKDVLDGPVKGEG